MSTELAVRKQELKLEMRKLDQELIKSTVDSAVNLLKNPVLEIILGYLVIEACQKIEVGESITESGSDPLWLKGLKSMIGIPWSKQTVTTKGYLIPHTAGTVAEAGILVAVAMQQPATLELLKSAITAGGESMSTLLKLMPAAFTALK